MAIEQFGYTQQLHRSLSTRDLVVYGMIFMVPIAPYSVFGFVWHDARGMVPLAYLVGLVGMFFTAMSYAAMSREFPLAGSVYTYAQRGLSEAAGFFAGWLILLDYILIPALLYLFAAVALRPLFPGVPEWLWLVAFIAINAVVNLLGIQFTARVNRYMLALELLTLGLFVIAGLHALQSAGGLSLRPLYDPVVFSPATVVGATSIAVLSFLGFDGISTLAEESRGGQDGVGKAALLSLLLIGTLFMLQTWIAADLARDMRFESADTAFYEIAGRAGGPWLRLISILVVVMATAIANAIAAQAAVSRILFAMARDGKLPEILAKIHPRYRTPYVSTLAVAALSLGVGLCFGARIDDLSRIINFGALSGFMLLHASVINHFFIRRKSRDWLRHLVFPLLGACVIGFVLYEMDRSAKVLGACWIAIGLVYYAVLTRVIKRPPVLEV
jgi:amino acid transporter